MSNHAWRLNSTGVTIPAGSVVAQGATADLMILAPIGSLTCLGVTVEAVPTGLWGRIAQDGAVQVLSTAATAVGDSLLMSSTVAGKVDPVAGGTYAARAMHLGEANATTGGAALVWTMLHMDLVSPSGSPGTTTAHQGIAAFATDRYYRGAMPQLSTSGYAMVAHTSDVIFYQPRLLARRATPDRIACKTWNAAQGAKVKLGLFRATSDSVPKPGARISQSGDLTPNAGLTYYDPACGALEPGLYHLAIWGSGDAAFDWFIDNSGEVYWNCYGWDDAFDYYGIACSQALAYAANLPDPAAPDTLITSNAATLIKLAWRFSS